MMLKNFKLFCMTSCLAVTACTTVTDKIPTVKIERKKPKVVKTIPANYASPKVHKAEAALVCENENMRSRSIDKNLNNDTARVLVLEEGGRSSNIIADVEVNCREYFQSPQLTVARQQSLSPILAPTPTVYAAPQSIAAVNRTAPKAQTIISSPPPQVMTPNEVIKASTHVQAADGYYYSIKKGDTLYRICLLYTSPSPRDRTRSRMPSSA